VTGAKAWTMEKVIIKLILLFFTLFIISFIFLIINTNKLGGDTLSGCKEEEKYYIRAEEGYKETTSIQWYYNYSLWIFTLSTGINSIVGFVYLMIRYILPFVITHSKVMRE